VVYPIPAGGYKRNIRDASRDLDSIEDSLPTAVKGALLGIAERLMEEYALPLTPVDTGFMRSRWTIIDTLVNEVTLSNDTYYLPFVNTWSHPNFAETIAEHTPSIAEEELTQLGFVVGVTSRNTELVYNKTDWWARKATQDPMKWAQYGAGVWPPYRYEGF